MPSNDDLRQRYPEQPWLWREDWVAGLSHVVEFSGNRRRFNVQSLRLKTLPGAIGGVFAAELSIRHKGSPQGDWRVTLTCIRTYWQTQSHGRRLVHMPVWQTTEAIDVLADPKRDEILLQIVVEIADDARPTQILDDGDAFTWELRIDGDNEAGAMVATFEVPVFQLPEPLRQQTLHHRPNTAQLHDAVTPVGRDAPSHKRSGEPNVGNEATIEPDGIRFKSSMSQVPAGLWAMLFVLISLTTLAVLGERQDGVVDAAFSLFLAFFGLIVLAIVGTVAILAWAPARLKFTDRGLVVNEKIVGYRRRRFISWPTISDVYALQTTGSTIYGGRTTTTYEMAYRICADTRNGRTHFISPNLQDRKAITAVIAAIRRRAGLPLLTRPADIFRREDETQ